MGEQKQQDITGIEKGIESITIKETEWTVDTSEEAMKQRLKEEGISSKLQQESPIEVLKKSLGSTDEETIKSVKSIKKKYELKNRDTICLLYEALLYDTDDLINAIKKYGKVISTFIKGPIGQKVILGYTEELVGLKKPELLKDMPLILEAFYDADILEEDEILEWYEKKKSSYVKDVNVLKKVKEASKPFIDWLKYVILY